MTNTADGTANSVNDYTNFSTTHIAQRNSKTNVIEIGGDDSDELDETFGNAFKLINAIVRHVTTVTITDDDGVPTLSIADISTSDETANTVTATVTLTGATSQIVTVNYATANGTATAGEDYTALSNTPLTFNAGDTTKTIDVTILADPVDEDNETFTISLNSPTNANLSSTAGSATVTITDDDDAPTISILTDQPLQKLGSKLSYAKFEDHEIREGRKCMYATQMALQRLE